MSDKDRQKKDGERKDKKNQRMRENVIQRQEKDMTARQRDKHIAKLTDNEPRGEGRRRLSNE
jgi:hypothetical protein